MRSATLLLAAALVAPTAAGAQALLVVPVNTRAYHGYDTVKESRAALAGQETRVWWAQMVDPDCSPHGSMTTAVVEAPQHGVVRVSDEPFFPSYGPENPRAACDTRKVAGKQAFYTASAGFKGHDRVVLQNSTSEGRIRKIVIDVDVR